MNKVYVADGAGSGSWQHTPGSTHGEIYLESASVSVGPTGGTITNDAHFVNVGPTWTLNVETFNTSLHSDNKAIEVAVTGHYLISAFVSFATGAVAAGTKYAMKYRINDSATLSTRRIIAQKETAGVDQMTMGATAMVMLTAGDYVDIMIASSVADTVTVSDAGITLVLLHET